MSETNRCTCADVEGAPSEGCLGTFWDPEPQRLCGDPICPPCWEDLQGLLARLKAKGVTVEIAEERDGD